MPRRIDFITSVVLFTLCLVIVEARYYPHNRNEGDFPGHSDLYHVTGSSGFGCQVADHEVIPYRTPDRSGEDDGSLWTGETTARVGKRYYAKDSEDAQISCNGTVHLPTIFWIGPYLQGENGANNNFAIGMLAFETNSTDKSDAWHVYRPCLTDYIRSDPPDDVFNPSPSAFQILAGVHYSNSTPPPDNTTIGLSLLPHAPGTEAAKPTTPQIYFNGTFNDLKETKEYYSDGSSEPEFRFVLETDLNCTRLPGGKLDWEPSKGAIASIPPGSPINGTLSNDTIVLQMTGLTKTDSLIQEYTNVGFSRTDLEFTFEGRFDARNSSQNVIINTTSETVVTFSVGGKWHPSVSLLYGVLGVISVFNSL